MKDLGGDKHSLDRIGRKKVWGLLKKKYPKIAPVISVGKKDRKDNIITNHMGLKHLYLETYVQRLRNRPIKQEFDEIKSLKTKLFHLRLKACITHQTKPWEMKHLDNVLKDLKVDKVRDPNGWTNF